MNSHNQRFKKKLLVFLSFHVNKRLDLYYDICRELMGLISKPMEMNIVDDIKIAINEGMKAKAKSLIRRY